MSGKSVSKPNIVAVAALAAVSMLSAGPACARLIELQTQVHYDLLQTKKRGFGAIGDGRLSTSYNLALRRPFLATSSLVSDLTINTTETGNAGVSQTSKNWTLNMYSNKSKYMLVGRVSHSDYGTFSDTLTSSNGYASDYNLSLFLRQPAYPVVNLQYLRNTTSTTYAGSTGDYTSTNWLMSSYYDLEPLRLSYDRTQQTFAYSGASETQMTTQRSAATLNHTLLPGLSLFGELSRASTAIGVSGGSAATNTDRRTIRLTATPTRAMVVDFDLTSQALQQGAGSTSANSSDNSRSWSVRSELMPGLSVNYEDQRQSQTQSMLIGTNTSVSRNRNLALSARLSEQTILTIGGIRSEYGMDSTDANTRMDSIQSAIQTSLTPTTDLSLNYGKSKSVIGAGDLYDNSFFGASIRDRTSATISVGATYRRTNVRSVPAEGSLFHQYGDVVDVDLLWQPTFDMGLNFRLSYQNNRGSGQSKMLAPSANLRWQVDSSTSLTANYSLQSYQQPDTATGLLFGQDNTGLSLRLTHAFARNSSLDVSYDFQGTNIGDIEWRKQLRMYLTTYL